MRKYLNLRIDDYRKLELQGQSQIDLNWKTISEFKSIEELVKFVIKYRRYLLKENCGATMYDLSGYGLNNILNATDDEILNHYMKGNRVLD